jgi:hypothetical protein
MKIKEKCALEFSAYEDCISRHPQEMTKCLSEFQSFVNCADRVGEKTAL